MTPFCFLNLITAAICGVIAYNKGRNVVGWTLLGILGLIPVIIVACLPNLTEQQARDHYVDEENRRLREQLRQERLKSEAFRQHAAARLDAHDQHLGIDTRTAGPALGSGTPAAGQLGAGSMLEYSGEGGPETQWFYGHAGKTVGPVKATQIAELIRLEIITRETLLWSEAMADWQPAGQVRVFAEQFV